MADKAIDFNETISYRPGILLGRTLHSLAKEYKESRHVIGKNLACLSLAGFSVDHYGDIQRAAATVALVDPRDSFAVACRLLGPRWAKAKKGESVKTLVDKFNAQLLRLLDDDTSWVNLGTLNELVGQL